MATFTRSLRRGLPRTGGGEPWPPAGGAPPTVQSVTHPPQAFGAAAGGEYPAAAERPAPEAPAGPARRRRGLPRPGARPVSTGIPEAGPTAAVTAPQEAESSPTESAEARTAASMRRSLTAREGTGSASAPPASAETGEVGASTATPAAYAGRRRGLPKPGLGAHAAGAAAPSADAPANAPKATPSEAPAGTTAKREPKVIGSRTLGQWAKVGATLVGGAVVAAVIIVLAARGITTLPGVPEFLERFPGEYQLPEFTDPGFPAWARWTHFLNFFLMALIIRSGWQVRTQQKPPAFWTPKRGGKKVSINLWLHTSVDVLWLANGVVFVVLLFMSGHWARILPTSWEVFPNAASALLQYLTLEWPVENGWVNYNSLQQIMYFLVVFVAAPLAAITGVRMSEWWPKDAKRLNKAYPAPLARAIHFPTMLFFVIFIIVHVFLVFSTGALRNLNHMFTGTDAVNWTGFWLFALGLTITVGAVVAARPLVLAPIANLFGRVSNR